MTSEMCEAPTQSFSFCLPFVAFSHKSFCQHQNYLIKDMFDKTKSGTIDIYEFGDLFKYVNQWKGTFESIDTDRSGAIEFQELTRGNFYYVSRALRYQ